MISTIAARPITNMPTMSNVRRAADTWNALMSREVATPYSTANSVRYRSRVTMNTSRKPPKLTSVSRYDSTLRMRHQR